MKENSSKETDYYLGHIIKENIRNEYNSKNYFIEKEFENQVIFILNLKCDLLYKSVFQMPEEFEKTIQSLMRLSKKNREAIEYIIFTLQSLSKTMNLYPLEKLDYFFKKIGPNKFQEYFYSIFTDPNYYLFIRIVNDDENSFFRACYLNYLHFIISEGKIDLFLKFLNSNFQEYLKLSNEKFHKGYENFLEGLEILSNEYKANKNPNNSYLMLYLISNLFPCFDIGAINFVRNLIIYFTKTNKNFVYKEYKIEDLNIITKLLDNQNTKEIESHQKNDNLEILIQITSVMLRINLNIIRENKKENNENSFSYFQTEDNSYKQVLNDGLDFHKNTLSFIALEQKYLILFSQKLMNSNTGNFIINTESTFCILEGKQVHEPIDRIKNQIASNELVSNEWIGPYKIDKLYLLPEKDEERARILDELIIYNQINPSVLKNYKELIMIPNSNRVVNLEVLKKQLSLNVFEQFSDKLNNMINAQNNKEIIFNNSAKNNESNIEMLDNIDEKKPKSQNINEENKKMKSSSISQISDSCIQKTINHHFSQNIKDNIYEISEKKCILSQDTASSKKSKIGHTINNNTENEANSIQNFDGKDTIIKKYVDLQNISVTLDIDGIKSNIQKNTFINDLLILNTDNNSINTKSFGYNVLCPYNFKILSLDLLKDILGNNRDVKFIFLELNRVNKIPSKCYICNSILKFVDNYIMAECCHFFHVSCIKQKQEELNKCHSHNQEVNSCLIQALKNCIICNEGPNKDKGELIFCSELHYIHQNCAINIKEKCVICSLFQEKYCCACKKEQKNNVVMIECGHIICENCLLEISENKPKGLIHEKYDISENRSKIYCKMCKIWTLPTLFKIDKDNFLPLDKKSDKFLKIISDIFNGEIFTSYSFDDKNENNKERLKFIPYIYYGQSAFFRLVKLELSLFAESYSLNCSKCNSSGLLFKRYKCNHNQFSDLCIKCFKKIIITNPKGIKNECDFCKTPLRIEIIEYLAFFYSLQDKKEFLKLLLG